MSSPDVPARSSTVSRPDLQPTDRPRVADAPDRTRVAQAPPSSHGAPAAPQRPAGARRARLVVSRVDPWSVMKLSFLLSIALGIVMVIAVSVLWYVLDSVGVFTTISEPVSDISEFQLLDYTGFDRILGITVVVAVVNVVLMTALATLAAFLYNICASLVGGLHLTLSDDA